MLLVVRRHRSAIFTEKFLFHLSDEVIEIRRGAKVAQVKAIQ